MRRQYSIVNGKLLVQPKTKIEVSEPCTCVNPIQYVEMTFHKNGRMIKQVVPCNRFMSPDENHRYWQGVI